MKGILICDLRFNDFGIASLEVCFAKVQKYIPVNDDSQHWSTDDTDLTDLH
jgi:hypothetical protein